MARSFDVSVQSAAGVAEILTAFGDRDYWQARLAAYAGAGATLDRLEVDAAGAVMVTVTLRLLRDRLPTLVTQLYRGDLTMVRDEAWRPGGDVARGDIRVAVPGAPVSAHGTATLTSQNAGSELFCRTTVRVAVPFVGGKLEDYLGRQFCDGIPAIQNFTSEWIAERR
ncbi:DUF2505 domain-containing protein [Mycolicibacterium brisbanense]|uniref:DUF2505 domain-containing protein n=1 Tax=Mycolicibacterium brisbanense TaxID=146020 RepID=A0A117I8D2_9MYCO|nr:DUF2505 domain-containing protein [Mycolicibacterium brisbanense]MCV7159106.1 DUF2505 domain-containing protein [Mycolicibacterium brisbanense]GAS93020.1 uncharacterized protein RMCB_7116 [Mycolicibacterium brisbanense]